LQHSTLAKRVWLLFFLAIIACYFYGLGRPPLVGPDEPRYAQVAREMFTRGDAVTPTLGGHTWFEKPSLLYWMMMASYGVFGVTEFAARFGPACAGLLTVLLIFWMGKRVELACDEKEKQGGLGQWSSLALATSIGIIIFSRGASFDIIVTMTVTLALACFYVSEIESDGRRRLWLLAGFYAGIGLSLLAKGLVGIVIPFGVVGAYFLLRRTWPERRVMVSLLWGMPLALALAASWYWPVTSRHGWTFIDDFFIQHHFARYVSNKYHHPQPFYFYLPMMALLAFPWMAFLIASLGATRRWSWRKNEPLSKFHVFALAWLIVPVAFFSLSVSKLPGYVLPALPGALLLAGEYLVRFLRGEKSKAAMRVTGALLLCLVIAGAIYAARTQAISNTCMISIAAPLALAGIFLLIWTHLRKLCVVLVICSMLVTTALAATCLADLIGRRESVRALMQLASQRGYSQLPVYGLHTIEHTAEFYASGRVAREANGKPVRFEGPQQVLAVVQQKGSPVLVIVPVEFAEQLTGYALLETEAIGDNGTIALILARLKQDAGGL
jgi:4-amino-4-deoxy-L-arabinose transferase-like glycosyltransferase